MRKVFILFFFVPALIFSQQEIKGKIMGMTSNGNELPLMGANVLWEGTSVGSVSNKNGNFRISYDKSYKTLVVSYVGFSAQKIDVTNITKFLKIILQPTDVLDDIIIKGRKKTSATSYITSQNISTISSKELLKAACCNLSESFETNPSIDVNFSDAVSGTKQIKMLGLNSPYILITNENIPSVRGAAQVYGMSFIPGSWVESIQVTKGAGSVINGFESITGQINAELVKPLTDPKLFVNLYGCLLYTSDAADD